MTPNEVLAMHAGDAATCAAITDLIFSEPYQRLPLSFRRLILAYVVAARSRARRMAWSMRSLLDEPGFSAAGPRTRAAWIYLFGEEVLSESLDFSR
jgi:hypothetical protein